MKDHRSELSGSSSSTLPKPEQGSGAGGGDMRVGAGRGRCLYVQLKSSTYRFGVAPNYRSGRACEGLGRGWLAKFCCSVANTGTSKRKLKGIRLLP